MIQMFLPKGILTQISVAALSKAKQKNKKKQQQ